MQAVNPSTSASAPTKLQTLCCSCCIIFHLCMTVVHLFGQVDYRVSASADTMQATNPSLSASATTKLQTSCCSCCINLHLCATVVHLLAKLLISYLLQQTPHRQSIPELMLEHLRCYRHHVARACSLVHDCAPCVGQVDHLVSASADTILAIISRILCFSTSSATDRPSPP